MSQDKTPPAKDAGAEYAEIWGESIHTNRHLRTITVGLGIAVILLIIVVIRIASVDPPRPIVVRVDEIGRAEAVAYDVMEAQADPLDPTTKYFLNRFVYDFYSRRRATVEENWSRSLRFLTTDLANASFRAESQNIALLAAGAARDELQVDRVVLRIQANPQEPHSATADFDLVRLVAQGEVDRERWSLSLQFLFLDEIPPDLIVHNPMGIVITYLQGDRAVVTGDDDRALEGPGAGACGPWMDRTGSGMDCPGLSPQWSFHAGAVLSLLRGLPETGAPFREGIGRTTARRLKAM